MNQYYVYAHIEKENNVLFYIGIGKGKRAYEKKRNIFWTSFVEKYDQNYEVKFIANNISQDLAYEIENIFIAKFGKIHNGEGILMNWTAGGFAEGAFINLSFDDDTSEIVNELTDYGNQLFHTEVEKMNLEKVKTFLKEIIEDKATELRQTTISEITKKSKPRKSWVVPFCLSEQIKKKIN